MRKTLLAMVCGSLLALPAVANAAKHHKRPHASKKVKHRKVASARPHLVLSGDPAPAAKAEPAPAPAAPAIAQASDNETPKR